MKKIIITILGRDQPGILATISKGIYLSEGNIENVSQTLLQSIFSAIMIVDIPEVVSLEKLESALRETSQELGLIVHVNDFIDPKAISSEENQSYVLTVAGPDQRGLVLEVSHILASHNINIINMQGLFMGGDRPLDNLMIFEVDVPKSTVMRSVREELAKLSEESSLEINIQHKAIFDVLSRI